MSHERILRHDRTLGWILGRKYLAGFASRWRRGSRRLGRFSRVSIFVRPGDLLDLAFGLSEAARGSLLRAAGGPSPFGRQTDRNPVGSSRAAARTGVPRRR